MRSVNFALAVLMVVGLAGCRRDEIALTGSYGNAVVVGQVIMSDGVANSSPAGVEVSVAGTGMVVTLGDDGRFTFVGVPSDAELVFQRAADGVGARLPVQVGRPMTVELRQSSASVGGRRRGAAPKREYEGLVRSIDSEELVMFTSHKEEVTIAIDELTIIRKGNRSLTVADLKVDDRIHVKAILKDDVLTALEIKLQNPAEDGDDGDDEGQTMTANGLVLSQSGTELVVMSPPKGEVTVQTDGNTIIKRQGERIAVTDIKAGDEANCMGQRIDESTLLARQIEVRGNSKKKGKP